MNFITFDFMNLTPAYSAEAWPGARKLYMNGSNHSQMKNDANTKTYLKRIYDASAIESIDIWWRVLPK